MYYLSDNAKTASALWFLVGLFVFIIMAKKTKNDIAKYVYWSICS